jgi:Flp pilus assembly protein TadD
VAHGVPDDATVRAARGRVLLLQGRHAEAAAHLDAALASWPADLDLLILRGFAAQQLGRKDEARGWYEKAKQAAPADPRPDFYLESLK